MMSYDPKLAKSFIKTDIWIGKQVHSHSVQIHKMYQYKNIFYSAVVSSP